MTEMPLGMYDGLPVRRAAKLVIPDKDLRCRFAFVEGRSGRVSLAGGGLEPEETPAEAAVREIHEELGCKLPAQELRPLGHMARRLTAADGTPFVGHWILYEAPPLHDTDVCPDGREVVDCHWLDLAQILCAESPLTGAAKEAMILYLRQKRGRRRTLANGARKDYA